MLSKAFDPPANSHSTDIPKGGMGYFTDPGYIQSTIGQMELSEIEKTLKGGIETLMGRRMQYGDKYGDVYKQFGPVMMALFPQGIHIDTNDMAITSATKLGVIVQIVTKLMRYCASLDEGGHKDSAHDLMNYSAMLESITPD
jgi:hypothetical protein